MQISPEKRSKKFFKALERTFHRAFKKIRIKPGQFRPKQCNEVKWLNLKTKLLEAKSKTSNLDLIKSIDKQIQFVELQITKIIADKNAEIMTTRLSMVDSLDGNFSQLGFWKVKKLVFPTQKEPPTAKRDESGNLISSSQALKDLYLSTYKARLEHREIRPKYLSIMNLKEELWNLRYEQMKQCKARPWTLNELIAATKTLRNNKSRDPFGI